MHGRAFAGGVANFFLLLDELLSKRRIFRQENGLGGAHIFNDLVVEAFYFCPAFMSNWSMKVDKFLVFNFLFRQLHQAFVDDVTDMLEIGGEG